AKGGKQLGDIDRVPAYWPDNETVRQDMLDYALEVEHFDRHLARMLDLIASRGELDNTLVVVTSDHGMPFPRANGSAYEASNDALYLRNYESTRWPACNPETGYLNCDGGPTKTVVLGTRTDPKQRHFWQLCFGRRPSEELYDLKRDPDCVTNLADEPQYQTLR